MDTLEAKQDLIAAEASDWLVRMQDSRATLEERARFSDWLRQSPTHVAEYLAIADLWMQSRAVVDSYPSSAELAREAGGQHDNILRLSPVGTGDEAARIPSGSSKTTRFPLRVAIAAALALASVASVVWLLDRHDTSRHYLTGPGEKLTISLEEGSLVHLNSESEVEVKVNGRVRLIEMGRGEARFYVARDPQRPFVVATDRAVVKALGTVFDVYRRNDDTRVTVVEGKVEVSAKAQAQTAVAAEEVAVSRSGDLAKRPAALVEPVLFWTQHRLAFRGQPLSEVVKEFNRYNAPAMQIDDAELAGLEISGAFQANDPRSLLSYLEKHEGVSVTRMEDGPIVLRPRVTK